MMIEPWIKLLCIASGYLGGVAVSILCFSIKNADIVKDAYDKGYEEGRKTANNCDVAMK